MLTRRLIAHTWLKTPERVTELRDIIKAAVNEGIRRAYWPHMDRTRAPSVGEVAKCVTESVILTITGLSDP